MTLNCKVGDLAIVVRSKAGNEGKIVRCLELLSAGSEMPNGHADPSLGAVWRTDISLRFVSIYNNGNDCEANMAIDAFLRPIRPLDEPETITTDDEVTA